MNVCINASSLKDKEQAQALIQEAKALMAQAQTEEQDITQYVMGKLEA